MAMTKEEVAARRKAYREANAEKIRAYREANAEKIAAGRKAWNEANAEKLRAWRKANAATLPDYTVASNLRRRGIPVTPETIELKRTRILLSRAIKELKNV